MMRSKLALTYLAFGVLIDGGYALATFTGWEPGAEPRETIPADVRSSPGGYRSWHFWHSGYQGGK
jgi:hypothetical protein